MIRDICIVGLGGCLGSILRYLASLLVTSKIFPYATLSVNIIGSFIIGAVFALSIKETGISNNWRLFLATGICGGFTTFSAFSLENLGLLQNGKPVMALIYIFTSILLGIAASFLGYQLIIKN